MKGSSLKGVCSKVIRFELETVRSFVGNCIVVILEETVLSKGSVLVNYSKRESGALYYSSRNFPGFRGSLINNESR